MRLGIYVAAGPNPIFLRMFLLQMARQTVMPSFLAIFENGYKDSALAFASSGILPQLESRGVKVLHKHDPEKTKEPNWYFEALRMLMYDTDSNVFMKQDIDDFYTDQYVENMTGMLGDHDLSINLNSGILLVRPFHGDFKYKESVVMKHSPIGAAPTHVIFNRKFAVEYLGYLASNRAKADVADDELMAECASNGMDVHRVDGPIDYTYVSHGSNHSSYAWQNTGGRIYLD